MNSKRTTKYKDPMDYMVRYECKNGIQGSEEERVSNNQKAIDHLRQCNMQLASELDRMRREMLGLLHHEPECGTCLDTGWPWIPGEENGCPTEADIQASIQWAHDHGRDPDKVLAEDRRELGCHCQK